MNGPECKRPFRSHRRRCWIILKLIFKKWNGGRHGHRVYLAQERDKLRDLVDMVTEFWVP